MLNIVFIVLTALSTIVRIASKSIAEHSQWWWDDHFAILSLVWASSIWYNTDQLIYYAQLFEVPYLSLLILWLRIGLRYYPSVGFPYLFSSLFFFNGAICFTKLSAIFFYARVFGLNNRVFRLLL
ncbi:hypothetical protein ASPACDRAFT_111251 [Aspergillus aculeatus ATCC 16872]|uniref:Uncharacterized protein n=1 Tax=Aspergillus aculeatus (strain ATCC 16872 / CBS 172.66 / WB 5094) TaxID=690307 RepID=A0A1L9X4S7_ASPA1|nr:uncharacterized protein ASPACDRAFT_111251 [Aspergillus aculeatus ATCC 16872]OJK03452.1 hypothetical protein ASPACDRAFT_111251 [Aspergillus aculeatus ATCC 16872]